MGEPANLQKQFQKFMPFPAVKIKAFGRSQRGRKNENKYIPENTPRKCYLQYIYTVFIVQ